MPPSHPLFTSAWTPIDRVTYTGAALRDDPTLEHPEATALFLAARLLTREEGKTIRDSLGEVIKSVRILEYMAGEGTRLGGDTLPSDLPKNFVYTMKQPMGVVGAITPWNFPIAIPAWKIMPALVSGNTVVFKPSSSTSLAASKLVEILEDAGLPQGVLNLVLGKGEEMGEYLATHPGIDGVSFTGSTAVGEKLAARLAGTRLAMPVRAW